MRLLALIVFVMRWIVLRIADIVVGDWWGGFVTG